MSCAGRERPCSTWKVTVDDVELHDACGVVGVYLPHGDAARVTFFGIFSLQHRGQESAGIATADENGRIHLHRALGLVNAVFDEGTLDVLPGKLAIGHTRYSTTGSSTLANAQPLTAKGPLGEILVAHNGNIVNSVLLRNEAIELGAEFVTTTDTEVIAQLIAVSPGDRWEDKIAFAMGRLEGAYSLTILTKDAVFAVRDPHGFRPLCLGRLDGGWMAASETCALENVAAEFVREVEPGEIVRIDRNGVTSTMSQPRETRALCIFEHIYFSRPDSLLEGRRVYMSREAMGKELARIYPVEADIVSAVPDSATAAGIGYAHGSGIPFFETMVKNRYVGRTFIHPDQRLRDQGVRLKLTPMKEVIENKRLIMVDDSIVRGTTTRRVVDLLRGAGAKEIHLRVCAPPIRFPCHYGIDMPNREELLAANSSVEEVRDELGVDSLGFLDVPALYRSVAQEGPGFCVACFTGEYTVPVQVQLDKFSLERVSLRA